MIASVYIKDGNIHIYNESRKFTNIGGLVYELGRPLLDFVWYETERFEESFIGITKIFNHEFAHIGAKKSDFLDEIKRSMSETQQREIYVHLYFQMFYEFIYTFIESPRQAVMQLEERFPGAKEKLRWYMDFEWPASSSPFVEVVFADKERRLFRAAVTVVSLMSEHLQTLQKFIIHEIEVLMHYREKIAVPSGKPIDYIGILDEYHKIKGYENYYLEKPFRSFYGRTTPSEIAELYEINTLEDLFRFEFIKMIERDIFVKKCKNCERFFIPRGRADAEYCHRIFGDTNRKCSEVGAMIRYEKKVVENPILEAHKKAYRRLNSRTRNKKMSQTEFMKWSEEASKKRDVCLAGELPFEEFVEWLEQGRVRKRRDGDKV